MQQAGFNVVRMAEFAWVNLEPAEGNILAEDFKAIRKDTAAKIGVR